MNSSLGRVIKPEVLSSVDSDAALRNLADIRRINKLFGAHRIMRRLLRRMATPSESFSVLDVGAGSGDMAVIVKRAFPAAHVVSLDRQHLHLQSAQGPRVVADAFRLPFPDRAFDVVLCSLLLHEFPDKQVKHLLASICRTSRRAVIVLELHRHRFASQFLPATSWLFNWSAVTLHDGPVSVEAAFLPDELRSLGAAAGLERIEVRRHLPWFRLSLVAKR